MQLLHGHHRSRSQSHVVGSPSPSPSTEDPTSSAPSGEPAVIDIKDFALSGPESVTPDATITVKNMDSAAHSVTADGGEFDLVIEGSGATGTFKAPSEPGKYSYICKFHPSMVGTLVVK